MKQSDALPVWMPESTIEGLEAPAGADVGRDKVVGEDDPRMLE
jgi:hypothetical protein